ncbi:MAG: hypothetical protein IPJ45_15275 [Ignavibacteria bacterium]|nr:hypothetical protein [Ignavibacteria bacterium]
MLSFTVAVYITVALLGIYLFTKLFSKNPSKFIIGIIHGSLGLFGIACLIFYVSFSGADSPAISILLFVAALFVGGGMLAAKMTKKKFPLWIALIHIAFAATGIYYLIIFWLK